MCVNLWIVALLLISISEKQFNFATAEPANWVQGKGTQKEYLFDNKVGRKYYEARLFCRMQGADVTLPMIKSKEENDAIDKLIAPLLSSQAI